MKGTNMKKISPIIFLSFVIILLLAGCVKSSSISVKDEPNVKPPASEPTIVKQPIAEPPNINPPIVELPTITPIIPDRKLWESLGKTKSGDNYYSKTPITKSSNIISVSTYKIVTDDVRKQKIEEVKKYDLKKAIKYQYYEHEVRIDEIDCKNRQYRLTEVTHYDDKGNVLYNYTYTNEEWKNIPVLTGHDTLREKFCVPQKKPSKKKK
jgi:hypothetical protein